MSEASNARSPRMLELDDAVPQCAKQAALFRVTSAVSSSSVLDQVRAFLPQIESANQQLAQDIERGQHGALRIDDHLELEDSDDDDDDDADDENDDETEDDDGVAAAAAAAAETSNATPMIEMRLSMGVLDDDDDDDSDEPQPRPLIEETTEQPTADSA